MSEYRIELQHGSSSRVPAIPSACVQVDHCKLASCERTILSISLFGRGSLWYVLGYPKGLHGGDDFPVWKRASIASEPDLDIDGLPKVLVDTATRPDVWPVIAVRRGLVVLKRPDGFVDEKVGQASA